MASVRDVDALAPALPFKDIVPLVVVPLLVDVVVGSAAPDLELCAIDVETVGHIKALVAKDADSASGEDPLLAGGASASLDGDLSAVSVGSSGQALV